MSFIVGMVLFFGIWPLRLLGLVRLHGFHALSYVFFEDFFLQKFSANVFFSGFFSRSFSADVVLEDFFSTSFFANIFI